jgi:hypothetical protein
MQLGKYKEGYICAMNLQINGIDIATDEICTLKVSTRTFFLSESGDEGNLRAKAFKHP